MQLRETLGKRTIVHTDTVDVGGGAASARLVEARGARGGARCLWRRGTDNPAVSSCASWYNLSSVHHSLGQPEAMLWPPKHPQVLLVRHPMSAPVPSQTRHHALPPRHPQASRRDSGLGRHITYVSNRCRRHSSHHCRCTGRSCRTPCTRRWQSTGTKRTGP